MKRFLLFFWITLFVAGFSLGQEQYGNIRGRVVDKDNQPLPGATVTLECALYGKRSMLTSEGGIFRFLNIPPTIYKLRCELAGFKIHLQENIDIRVGSNFDFPIILEQTTLAEEITVVARSPVVDTKKVGTGANVTQVMLQEIPSARDPWVILQQLPGVEMSKENVGGSMSGQQPAFLSKGSGLWGGQTMWNLDGISITDLAASGSPFYYDFDTFEEMQVVTSGQDAAIQTGGVSINFVTRRGGNRFQAMGRVFFTNDDLQSDNRTAELEKLGYVGNRIKQLADYGLQFGGPLLKDKLWFWLGYGIQDIRHIAINGYPDNKIIESFNAKLNFQLSRANRMEFAYMYPNKKQDGRGAGPTRPPETTWIQRGSGLGYFKLEDEHVFSDSLLLTLKLAYFDGNFKLTPTGGVDTQQGYDIITGMYSGSFEFDDFKRPSYSAILDGNWFLEKFLGGSHEIKFGGEIRITQAWSQWKYGGDVQKRYRNGVPYQARVSRGSLVDAWGSRYSAYISDIYTRGRLSMSLSLRLDREHSWLAATEISASRIAPDLLPALTIPSIDPGVTLWTFSPRIGFTFDLTGDGRTILRGNIARYGDYMPTQLAGDVSPSMLSWAAFYWSDLNGDNLVSLNELDGYPSKIIGFSGFDPANPTSTSTRNAIDKNLKSPLTDEILLGIERELFENFSLSAHVVFRRWTRLRWQTYYDKATGTKVTRDDYVGPITGSLEWQGKVYNYKYWTLNRYRPAGYLVENSDYRETYSGFEITAFKRLSHRWMLNASFTYQNNVAHFGYQGWAGDPTDIEFWEDAPYFTVSSRWMGKVSFLYQLPWGFNLSGFFNAREGTIFPANLVAMTPERAAVGLDSYMYMSFEKWGARRLPVFYNMDLGLSKEFRLKDYGKIILSVDAFNIFNFSHTLQRYDVVNSSRFEEIVSILNPRVIRLGLKYNF